MIPAPFRYARPTTVDEALQAVAEGGEDVKILAGGQSLIPVMRLRLAAPETVVDLGKVAELRGVRDDGDAIVIGAMTTHSDVLADGLIAQHAPLIARATETVADRQVRHRGTFGGALAHADPAGDLPAVALAQGAGGSDAAPPGRNYGWLWMLAAVLVVVALFRMFFARPGRTPPPTTPPARRP